MLRDSANYMSISPQTSVPSRLSHDTEQSSLLYTVGCFCFINGYVGIICFRFHM